MPARGAPSLRRRALGAPRAGNALCGAGHAVLDELHEVCGWRGDQLCTRATRPVALRQLFGEILLDSGGCELGNDFGLQKAAGFDATGSLDGMVDGFFASACCIRCTAPFAEIPQCFACQGRRSFAFRLLASAPATARAHEPTKQQHAEWRRQQCTPKRLIA